MTLRITVQDEAEVQTLLVEGSLVGPWVKEVETCWQQAVECRPDSIVRLNLSAITLIDGLGKAFLAKAHAQGTKLLASGCLMRAIVAEIASAPHSRAEIG